MNKCCGGERSIEIHFILIEMLGIGSAKGGGGMQHLGNITLNCYPSPSIYKTLFLYPLHFLVYRLFMFEKGYHTRC